MRNQEVCERQKGPLLCVAYKDGTSRPVLLSTSAKAGSMEVVNKRGQRVQRPKAVVAYNKAMGGVDLSDSKLYRYLSERRTIKWTTKLAFSLFGRAIVNSFQLYKQNTTANPKLNRYQYMVSVVESMAGEHYPRKVVRKRRTATEIQAARANPQPFQVPPPPPEPQAGPAGDAHKLVKLAAGKRRNCVAGHDSRVRSVYRCSECDVGLCAGCFSDYHKKRPRT